MRSAVRTQTVLISIFTLCLSTAVNAGWPEGNWYLSTSLGIDIFKFEKNNYFIFQSNYSRDGDKKSYKLFGRWNYQYGLCRPDENQELNEGATADGNLVLYLDSTQCCLNAVPLDNKLALRKLWLKGSGLADYAYCSDHLLTPYEPVSD